VNIQGQNNSSMYNIFRTRFSLSRALFRKNVGPLPNTNRPISHNTHSDSVVIIDILLRTRKTIIYTQ